jgi:hypothetical protein
MAHNRPTTVIRPMSEMGQKRQFHDVRATSAHALKAAAKRTSEHFAFVPHAEIESWQATLLIKINGIVVSRGYSQ